MPVEIPESRSDIVSDINDRVAAVYDRKVYVRNVVDIDDFYVRNVVDIDDSDAIISFYMDSLNSFCFP